MVRRLPILWLCLALLVASCRGDSADDPLDAPPWGLDHIDMPDTEEEVVKAISAMPEEIGGRTRSSGGAAGVMYEQPEVLGLPWIIQAQPDEQIATFGMSEVRTAEDWLRYNGLDRLLGGSEWERAPPETCCGWPTTGVRRLDPGKWEPST